jgi:hypothetical protein
MITDKFQRLTVNAIFFTGIYLYIWLVIDPRLIFHGGGIIREFPVFFFDMQFLLSQLVIPGGLSYYLSAFLSQFLYISWAGALVITIIIVCYTLMVDALIKKMNAKNIPWLRFAPAFILIALYSGYSYHFTSSLALLIALFSTWMFLSIPIQSELRLAIAFTLFSLITYWIAGAAFFVFAISVILYFGTVQRRLPFTLFGLALAIVIPYLTGTLIFEINPADSYRIRTPLYWQEQLFQHSGLTLASALYLLLPFYFIYLALAARIKIPFASAIKTLVQKVQPTGWLKALFQIISLSAIGYTTYYVSFNQTIKQTITIDYLAYHKQWHNLLEKASGTINNSYLTAAINRALYHSHKLGDLMPLWQEPGDLLLMKSEYATAYWYKFDLYLDLGFINMAQHNLNEALEFYGEQPLLLKRLALVHLIKGNMGTAKIYLNSLSKTLFYCPWAQDYLQAMREDPQLDEHQEISFYRSIALEKDYPFPYSTDHIFRDLLEKNSQNRMAFEYMMAFSLLHKDFRAIMDNLNYLKNFNYPAVPKLYQQAIVLITSNPENRYPLPEVAISMETIELFQLFFRTINQYREDRQKAIDVLKEKYSNNYFFYCLTH